MKSPRHTHIFGKIKISNYQNKRFNVFTLKTQSNNAKWMPKFIRIDHINLNMMRWNKSSSKSCSCIGGDYI